jgi:WD40 repeat protein
MLPYKRRLAAMPEEKRLYILEAMPSHLAKAGQSERLHEVLTTYAFLKAKVDAIGAEQLIDDYKLTTDTESLPIQSALKSCAHILLRDKGQFLVQLSGRILEQTLRSKLFMSDYLQEHSLFLNFPTLAVNEDALVRTFTGHTGVVLKVVAGTNETFWSAAWDHTVIEWDINRNEPLTIFNHPHDVDAIAVSPDKRYVISGDHEGYLYIWDCKTKELVNQIRAHKGYIGDIKFGGDSIHVISGSFDQTAIIWQFLQGRLVKSIELKGHHNGVNAVYLDHEKAIAITGSWDNSICVYNLKTEHSLRLTDHRSGVRDIYYDSEHNNVISASNDRTVRIWSIDSGLELVRLMQPGENPTKLTSVVRIPSRNLIVAGGENGHLYFWETDRFKFLGELATGSIAIYSLSILNSQYLLAAGENQAIRAYDIMRLQPGKSFSHEHYVSSVCITAVNRAISVASRGFLERELYYWDMATHKILMSTPDAPRLVLRTKHFIDDSGTSQVVLCSEQGAYLWRVGTSNISKLDNGGSNWITDAELMPQRKILLICHGKGLLLLDIRTYELVMEIPVDDTPLGRVAISPDETYIAHVAGNGQINIYDAHTGEKVWTKLPEKAGDEEDWEEEAWERHPLDIEFSQENCFITVSRNKIRLWSLTQEVPLVTRSILRPESEYGENIGTFGQIAISNNRELLVLAVNDLHLRIFNTLTLELIATFTHRSAINNCAIASDLERENVYHIVVGDAEGEVHFLQLYV